MVKRVAASVLWFLAVGWGMDYLTVIVGAPSVIGLAVSGAVAVFVGIDPLHLFWPAPAPSADARTVESMIVSGTAQPNG
ncbi:MAG TPA: hypothetical protein VGQ31_14235 [Candidatus Limnocylindrales bacterium]|nr:hypothetical protein [Candidatus Limnocylindrales bacterium]